MVVLLLTLLTSNILSYNVGLLFCWVSGRLLQTSVSTLSSRNPDAESGICDYYNKGEGDYIEY